MRNSEGMVIYPKAEYTGVGLQDLTPFKRYDVYNFDLRNIQIYRNDKNEMRHYDREQFKMTYIDSETNQEREVV